MDRQEVYAKAIEKFGEYPQIIQAVQELAELQKELTKYCLKSHDDTLISKIAEEMADVEIMLEQLKMIFKDIDFQVINFKQQKIDRLKGMVCCG